MGDSLEAIGVDVRGCRSCRLCQTRTVGVPGEGAANADLFFIGEGPGFHEDQQGRPFVGAAGGLLAEMLRLIDLRRQDVFITNVVRCRPPGNRDPLPDELAACDSYTQRQIAVLEPKLIVTLGRFSMARFVGTGPMRELHGRARVWNGITVLPMYHPAAILRTPTAEMKRMYEADFRKIPLLLAEARKQHEARMLAAAQSATAEALTQLELGERAQPPREIQTAAQPRDLEPLAELQPIDQADMPQPLPEQVPPHGIEAGAQPGQARAAEATAASERDLVDRLNQLPLF